MFCTFVYATADDAEFERSVPLAAHGEILKVRGLENGIHVLVMLGYKRLSPGYLRKLETLGYIVWDVEKEMQPILARFPAIARLPTYYAYNYLRWILPEELLEQGKLKLPLVCVDGDLVFLSNISEIERDIDGKTFILQGCPCFVSIGDRDWFRIFERELAEFCSRPERTNALAADMLVTPVRADRDYCNVRAYSTPLRHEQDLQECLVAAGILPQARTIEVFERSPFYWVQNPIAMGEWAQEQGVPIGRRRVTEQNSFLTVAGKQLPFIHFQNDFAWYAHCWLRFSNMGLRQFGPVLRERTRTGSLPLKTRILGGLLRRIDPKSRCYSRAMLYENVVAMNPESGNMYATDIMNTCW